MSSSTQIRNELLVKEGADGIISLYDPLLQTVLLLNEEESVAFRSQEYTETLKAKLQGANMMEGIGAKVLRDCIWNARSMFRVVPQPRPERTEADWEQASLLPDFVQERWRKPQIWASLFQYMLAGNDVLMLDDLFVPEILQKDIERFSFVPFQNKFIQGHRAPVNEGVVYELMEHPVFYSFVRSLLGLNASHSHCLVHAWQLSKGDFIGLHSDGPRYQGTFNVGVTPNWKAQNGGAIAFGRPTEHGVDIFQRWIPQLGSALLFAPRSDLWHVVETVQAGVRHTLTGWWTDQKPHVD